MEVWFLFYEINSFDRRKTDGRPRFMYQCVCRLLILHMYVSDDGELIMITVYNYMHYKEFVKSENDMVYHQMVCGLGRSKLLCALTTSSMDNCTD